ncbi:endonuclease domain-containing protein [Microbispora sp. CSR-4]|uniref:endonuclease domain-containing protein n=1 Tax=Microbispora sp. CSR-4 TaxID=2592813 RepID=UPI0011C7D169|nr:endonuclease domain-containing protein [Microbispora sp. CSR-4]
MSASLHVRAGKLCHHLVYRLDCDEYDRLVKRAGGACELCQRPTPALQIDHDHAVGDGWEGVRGLVCPKCNSHLMRVDAGVVPISEACARYLSNAWYRHLKPGGMHSLPLVQPGTGNLLRWWIRVPDDHWRAAQARARAEGRTVIGAIRDYLATYGAQAHPESQSADPWDVVNLVVREIAEGRVGPGTDLNRAVEAAASLLAALGITPTISAGPAAQGGYKR